MACTLAPAATASHTHLSRMSISPATVTVLTYDPIILLDGWNYSLLWTSGPWALSWM